MLYILKNERYIGDAMLQKTYKRDVLDRRKKNMNDGTAKMYYVTGNHTPIIDKETFTTVQAEFAKRSNGKDGKIGWGKYSSTYAFSRKLRCSECGSLYRRHNQPSRGKVKYTWVCTNHEKRKECKALPVREKQIEDAFMLVLGNIIENREELLAEIQESIAQALEATETFDTDAIALELGEKQVAILKLTKAKNVDEKEVIALMDEIDRLNDRLTLCTEAQTNITSVNLRLKEIAKIVELNNGLTEFSADLFKNIVDEATIKENKVAFKFKIGMTMEQEL